MLFSVCLFLYYIYYITRPILYPILNNYHVPIYLNPFLANTLSRPFIIYKRIFYNTCLPINSVKFQVSSSSSTIFIIIILSYKLNISSLLQSNIPLLTQAFNTSKPELHNNYFTQISLLIIENDLILNNTKRIMITGNKTKMYNYIRSNNKLAIFSTLQGQPQVLSCN